MKLLMILLTVAAVQVSAHTTAQTITYTGSEVPLAKVFKAIKKQTGYVVFYNANALEKARPITVQASNMPLVVFLQQVLHGQPFEYSIENTTIFIAQKAPVVNLPADGSSNTAGTVIKNIAPLPVEVTGRITTKEGIPLAGASVVLKRTGKGDIADANGKFKLNNVQPDDVVIVSFAGYVTQNIKPGDKTSLTVVLEVATSELDKVQVQAYGKTSKRLGVGTITTVSKEDIERQKINNPILALRAKVPNLVITQTNGLPGSKITMQLRGQNSMGAWSARSEPLIVIDGVPFENTLSAKDGNYGAIGNQMSALSLINPNDIEQIDVWSDADATAIYGSRGGNGVVMITTKRSKAGPTQVSVNVESGYSKVPKGNRMNLMNTAQYLELRKEALANDGFTAQVTDPDGQGYAPDLLLWNQTRDVDWQKELLGSKPAWTQANLSVSGGTNALRFLMSGNYRSDGVPYPTSFKAASASKNEMASGHLDLSGNSANGKFSAGVNFTYSYNNRRGTQTDLTKIAMVLPPNAPELYLDNGDLNWAMNPNTGRSTWKNPYSDLLNITDAKAHTLVASANMGYRLSPGLQVKITSSFTKMTQNQFGAFPLAAIDPYGDRNNYYGKSQRTRNDNNSFSIDPNITYQKQIGRGNLNAIAGMTYQGQTSANETLKAYGYSDDALIRDLTKASAPFGGSPYEAYNRSAEYKYLRVFSRFNYVLMDRYIANVSLSRDGSSRFGPENKYGNYWSTGLGWIFSNESFVKDHLPFLSYGKIRASMGKSGQDGIGDYKYLEQYTSGPSNSYDGVVVLDGQGVVNPYFKWENVRKLDVGFDFGILKDAIVGSVTYWTTRSSDQLLPVTTPSTAGAGTYYTNVDASIKNYGWEFTLNTKNISHKHFSWSSAANFGIQSDKLLKLSKNVLNYYYSSYFLYKNIDPVGKAYNKLIGVPSFQGVDPETGVFMFLDEEGKLTTAPDRDIYATSLKINPLTLGLTNSFTLGNFTFVADLQFRKQLGRSYFDDLPTPGRLDMPSGYGNALAVFVDRWKKQGDKARFQKATSDMWEVVDGWVGFSESDISYVDASYIRLSNALLSYSLPKRWMDKLKIRSANINISGQNLFTITGFKYGDPEIQNYLAMPTLKTITAGFSLNF